MSYYGFDAPTAAANGMGAYFTQQPPELPMSGMGDDYYYDDGLMSGAAIATVGLLWLGLSAAGGYVAGRAMAPTPSDRNSWGVVCALLGTLGGPPALGLIGLLALKAKTT
jgi:hypothetical protein